MGIRGVKGGAALTVVLSMIFLGGMVGQGTG